MQNRIVEITTEGAHLSVKRGFLSVALEGETLGQVAIDDISALIIRGYGCTFSVNICTRLAQANVPIVLCGSNQSPASVIWPVDGHFAQGLRMQTQAVAKKPVNKRLWAQLIKAKITAQADVLAHAVQNCADIKHMAISVKSGDPDNLEAQAARRYWPRLMGPDFKRDRTISGKNAALNYGYMVLRAACARAVLAAGLHPSLSIHHQSRGDALRLADDLMEPFRPWVDLTVWRLFSGPYDKEAPDLTQDHKQALAATLTLDMAGASGNSPMHVHIDRMAQSLAHVYAGDAKQLDLPGPPLPLAATAHTTQATGKSPHV